MFCLSLSSFDASIEACIPFSVIYAENQSDLGHKLSLLIIRHNTLEKDQLNLLKEQFLLVIDRVRKRGRGYCQLD